MTETRELEAKIAALAGRINLHKQQEANPLQNYTFAPSGIDFEDSFTWTGGRQLTSSKGYGRGHGRGASSWAQQRGTPYGVHRGRVTKFAPPAHRHRTLVLKNVPSPGQETPLVASDGNASGSEATDMSKLAPTWVSKRDRHMQLINTSVYDQLSQQRTRSMAVTSEQKQRERNLREKQKLNKHFQDASTQHYSSASGKAQRQEDTKIHEITVDNIRFQVTDGGSKLIRIPSEWSKTGMVSGSITSHDIADINATQPTPKQAKIGGVTFFRSKNGNLYRAGLVKAKKRHEIKKIAELCPKFTTTGSCSKGPHCRFLHDPHKVAICKDFLLKGHCGFGDGCDLSHQPNLHRVPACLHFLRGNCTNENCRYAHVRVNPASQVCRAFARLGYCEKGANCSDRHVFECPDYANKGFCRNEICHLPHVDRAGQIRKIAAAEGIPAADADESADLTSDEEDFDQMESDDVDSDGLEETFVGGLEETATHELSQQQDYVHL
ncbi:CCCH zinc finger protein [Lepidopterella palustris CBS 459.81]|uniref:CCCH zinc finger protein n=1 Tax=Lepidopterella palustris CBS 459.81 TaxID=1314670 RepID=A0A8E2EBG9_9PEZI|nr:CCCH zinc finger protein [Lepidopterella palustris CBS 459.81]